MSNLITKLVLLSLLFSLLEISCKKVTPSKINSVKSDTIRMVTMEYSNLPDTFETLDSTLIDTSIFLNSLRADPNSMYPNTITQTNNDLTCDVHEDYAELEYHIEAIAKKMTFYHYNRYSGSAGQYGHHITDIHYTYKNSKPDSLTFHVDQYIYMDYGEQRYKTLKFNYSGNTLTAITGTDSLFAYNYNTYIEPVTYSFSYPHSYVNPYRNTGLDVNDLALKILGLGGDEKFILNQLTSFHTQSDYLIEHVHLNYFNDNKYDISPQTYDLDVSYTFDPSNDNRLQSVTLSTYFNNAFGYKIRYTLYYK